ARSPAEVPGAMELTDFEALSFDCYGTLIDWETGLKAVLVPWARQRGLGLDGEELLAEYAAIEAAAEADHPASRYPDILARSMRLLGDRLGAEVAGDDAARLAGSVPDSPACPAGSGPGRLSRTRRARWPRWVGGSN